MNCLRPRPTKRACVTRDRHQYSDINVRRGGFYLARPLRFPLIIGNEAAGVVESVGRASIDVAPGDRVVYAGMRGEFFEETGAYAEARNVPGDRLIKLPDGMSDRTAAAMMVRASPLADHRPRILRPKPGDVILIHTAASGVGLILCQWSKHLGACWTGTSTAEPIAKRCHTTNIEPGHDSNECHTADRPSQATAGRLPNVVLGVRWRRGAG